VSKVLFKSWIILLVKKKCFIHCSYIFAIIININFNNRFAEILFNLVEDTRQVMEVSDFHLRNNT
jgi:hypothetical protein